MSTEAQFIPRKLLISVVLVFGIFFGRQFGSLVIPHTSQIQYQSIVKGSVSVQSRTVDGACPPWHENRIQLSWPIVTDGKTRGFALGDADVSDYDLSPDETDGHCYYFDEFDVLLSPTGVYELSFTGIGEVADQSNTFNAQPESAPFGLAGSVEPSQLWWRLTTIACKQVAEICSREAD